MICMKSSVVIFFIHLVEIEPLNNFKFVKNGVPLHA